MDVDTASDRVSELLAALDRPGPRYTSYPTADRFTGGFGAAEFRRALVRRASDDAAPLALYVHLPFCESVCYYCACSKIVTRRREVVAPYLAALRREIDLHVGLAGRGRPVSQLHLGGGSPTFLDDTELTQLMTLLRKAFAIGAAAELSIEVDPRTVDAARLRHLARLGFDRLSLGVQDVDPAVQQALHREQPLEQVAALMQAARATGFASINTDLIYGLPRQTPEGFARTVAAVGALCPDRIALYAYAHLPQRFKPQRRIAVHELPAAADRVHMLRSAISGFQSLGYRYIGMDHFALPDDPLARARGEGRLHRGFQGYTTAPDGDLIGLGVSAISQVGGGYAQNAKSLGDYEAALARGEFATERGLEPDAEDRLRRDAIMALMCEGRLALDALGRRHGVDGVAHFRDELERLREHEARGLLRRDGARLELTPLGWYFVRAVAMVFDRHLAADPGLERYSQAV